MRWWEDTASCLSQRTRVEAEGRPNVGKRRVRVGSSPDNDGTGQYRQMVRVRQARQKGVRDDASGWMLADRGPRSNAHPHSDTVCVR